jgi:hypothetical protein
VARGIFVISSFEPESEALRATRRGYAFLFCFLFRMLFVSFFSGFFGSWMGYLIESMYFFLVRDGKGLVLTTLRRLVGWDGRTLMTFF